MLRLRELVQSDQLAEALDLVREELADHKADQQFLRVAQAVAQRTGEISLQRAAVDLETTLNPSRRNRLLKRALLGRWRELSIDWTPTLDSPLEPDAPPRAGRILHVVKQSLPYRQSGYSVRSNYILQGQLSAGLLPVAVTSLDFPLSDGKAEELVDGVRYRRLLRAEVPEKPPADLYLKDWATALGSVAVEESPELIHVHSGYRGFDTAKVGLVVGEALHVPVIYEVRGFFEAVWSPDSRFNESSEMYRKRMAMETHCMQQADAVVTLSESMRSEIIARGIDPEAVFVVPNGVDTAKFQPRERSADLAVQLGLSGFVFGYVSNLDHYREAQELLIEAAVRLREQGIEATALIVGDGKRRELLEERAKELNVSDSVVFTGSIPHQDVLDYYALLDAFVVPRIDERAARLVTPLKPYEAMAMGIPLVVSALPALTEIAGDGARGLTFAPGDVDDLARVLRRLVEEPSTRDRVAAEALRWVRRERDWTLTGERYREIYAQVLSKSGRTAG